MDLESVFQNNVECKTDINEDGDFDDEGESSHYIALPTNHICAWTEGWADFVPFTDDLL